MASVNDVKQALLAEQQRAMDVADRAVSAIDTLLNLSMWTLGVLALVLAFIAVFGWTVIYNAARSRAERVANERLDSYLKGKAFKDELDRKVSRVVKEKLDNRLILANISEDTERDESDPFPPLPQGPTS